MWFAFLKFALTLVEICLINYQAKIFSFKIHYKTRLQSIVLQEIITEDVSNVIDRSNHILLPVKTINC